MQHRKSVGDRTQTKSESVHQARRKDRRAASVTKTEQPFERGEQFQVKEAREPIHVDDLHLYVIQLLGQDGYGIRHPIEKGRKDLVEMGK